MKKTLLTLSALAAALLASVASLHAKDDTSAKNCGCDCCKGKEVCCCNAEASATDAAKTDTAPRYPLKGVVVDVMEARGALLVKHEEIPGYMRAMTMMFKVDTATLKAAAKGQAITGQLVKKEDGFWLEDVKPAK